MTFMRQGVAWDFVRLVIVARRSHAAVLAVHAAVLLRLLWAQLRLHARAAHNDRSVAHRCCVVPARCFDFYGYLVRSLAAAVGSHALVA